MRSAFGSWVIQHRIARVCLVAALLPLFAIISAAIVVCIAIARGWRIGLADCLLALIIVMGLTVLTGGGTTQVLFSSVSTWGIALLMGGLTGVTGSLTLAIQVVIVLCCIAIIGFSILVDDPAAFWEPILQVIARQMQEFGVDLAAANAIMDLAPIMSGLFVAGTIASAVVALLLGCWWTGGVGKRSFQDLFLDLRLGYVVGGIAAVAGVGALLGVQPLAGNLLLVAGVGFMFQGLAVVHWQVARRGLPRALLIAVYLPLFFGASLMVMALFLFAAVGFIDNWYGLRRAKTI